MSIVYIRWVMYGKLSSVNVYLYFIENLVLVYNGIIENYVSLKKELENKGYVFLS